MSPTSAELGAQFDDLAACVAGTASAARTVSLAGLSVRFGADDPELLERFCAPMRHLPSSSAEPDLRVGLLWRDGPVASVPWRWRWEQQRYADGRYDFWVVPWAGLLLARDTATNATVFVVDSDVVDRMARPETSRPLLESLLSRRGLVSVHGGTVGDDETCVLLSARGGSGKSSLVAQAARRGYRTVGDDFLYLRPDGPTLYSAYATVKIAPDSPASDLIDPSVPVVDGKRLGWLPDIGPDCMAVAQRPVAIVVPSVGDRVALGEIDERAALTALLPSSLQLSSDRARATQALTALTRSLPCYALTVAGDADAELAALTDLAGELDRGRAAGTRA